MFDTHKRSATPNECDICGESVDYCEAEYVNGIMLCPACWGELSRAIEAVDNLPVGLEKIYFEIIKESYAYELGISHPEDEMLYVCSRCGNGIFEGDDYIDMIDHKFCMDCALDNTRVAGYEKGEERRHGNS